MENKPPAFDIKAFQKSPKDKGSAPVQAVLLTQKIKDLTKHFKSHKKDFHSMRGLMKMVSRRKKLLAYLKRTDRETWDKLISALSLRK